MRYVVTAEQMRAIDSATIHDIGLPGVVLMENAGRAIAARIRDIASAGARVAVCSGPGNNGGDGYVIARCLRAWGYRATVYLAIDREAVGGDALLHLRAFERCGGRVAALHDEATLVEHAPAIEAADVVVDALLGTGLVRDVAGHLAAVIRVINRARGQRIAVDVPSGLSADTGRILGVAVAAHRTMTVALSKPGLECAPGCARCGEVEVVEMGIPVELAPAHGAALAVVDAADVTGWLPVRSLLDHKSVRGHVLLIAGAPGMRGAGRMAACAALRSGAGLVTLAGTPPDEGAADEVMTAPLDAHAPDVRSRLDALMAGKRAIAIGPGMTRGAAGAELVRAVLDGATVPVVVDADALNHVGNELARVAACAAPVVLTPHPGEAGRLLDTSAAEVEADRVAAARELAHRSEAVVVLKGARTLVCDGRTEDPFVTINPTGNAGLATAGSGDVLTGTIAALLAGGSDAVAAARAGAFVHGLAGDMVARERGATGMVATDVVDALSRALSALETSAVP